MVISWLIAVCCFLFTGHGLNRHPVAAEKFQTYNLKAVKSLLSKLLGGLKRKCMSNIYNLHVYVCLKTWEGCLIVTAIRVGEGEIMS